MRSDLLRWLKQRAALLVAVLAFVLGQRCSSSPLPGHDVSRFAAFLGEAGSVVVDATSLRWEPSRGGLADAFLGRRLLFLGRSDAEAPRDVYRARVLVSREGQPLHVAAVENLSQTPAGEETMLQLSGQHAAYVAYSGDAAQGVTALDLAGAHPRDLPGNLFNRLLLRARAWQETDSFAGVARTHIRFAEATHAGLAFEGDTLRIERSEQGPLLFDAARGVLLEPRDDVQLSQQPLGSQYWLHTLADLLREEIGSQPVFQLARYAFGLSDEVRHVRHVLSGHDETPRDNEPSPPAERSASGVWPPQALPARFAEALPGEGVWVPAALPWTDPGAAKAPLFYTTFIRPDRERPYVQLHLVALDMRRLELRMEAGYEDPKPKTGLPGRGALPRDPRILARVKATFNGAFKSLHGDYGMMVDGRVLVPPVSGAATVALTEHGETAFGLWPPNEALTRQIVSLRQNLDPLVYEGKLNPSERTHWGEHLLAGGVLTERSALCRADNGHVYYAWGDGLSADTLADALRHAGCHFAMHLDMNPHHCGFFYHQVPAGDLSRLQAHPALLGTEIGPDRFALWSSKDFFYVLAREGSEGAEDWPANPGSQPAPDWLPAITTQQHALGSLHVTLYRVAAGRVRYALQAGSAEPMLEGRPAPERRLADSGEKLFALNLGHTTTATRYGLAFAPEATLPLRNVYATLLLKEDGLSVVAAGETPVLSAGQRAVQLPELLAKGELTARTSERGALRQRGALCVLPDGALLVASALHDSSDVLALTLRSYGCQAALELDRGSQHPLFFQRAGTQDAPVAEYETSVLVGLASSLRPNTFEWPSGAQ